MNPTWLDSGRSIVGVPPLTVTRPGIGYDRFGRANQILTQSGRDLAFASFTFDREDDGSVIVIPDGVEAAATQTSGVSQDVEICDDGVDAWRSAYKKAMEEIDQGAVDKVVIARQQTISTAATPGQLLTALASRHHTGFVFGIDGLVGASPELLVRVDDRKLTSQVLAGTTTLDGDPATERLVEEHAYAAESAIAALRPHLGDDLRASESVVAHGSVKHIATEIEGQLRPGVTVLDVLADLHPTAAVAGTPTDQAVRIIREVERRPRGRYAGPIGWFDRHGNGVFALALRCALFGDDVTLFAGGGLMAGSSEEDELEETELKLRTILDALGQS